MKVLKDKLQGRYLSLLGDSITTWDGISNVTTHNSTLLTGADGYPYYPFADVTELHQTYWQQVLDETGMKLLVNNAIGGSRAYGEENDKQAACNRRCENLHADTGELAGVHPDMILVYIGVNDVSSVDVTVEQFAKCYDKMLARITAKYAGADVFVMDIPHPAGPFHPVEKLDGVNGQIHALAAKYGAGVIRLRNTAADDGHRLTGDTLHPNAAGMAEYSKRICQTLYECYCKD